MQSLKIQTTSFGLPREAGGASHDAFGVKAWGETVLAVLADGAGSGVGACEAAQRAVRSFIHHYETRPLSWTPQKCLLEFARLINRTLHHDSLNRFGEERLVTTLAVAAVEGDRVYGVNVGDSRVYLYREGQLIQLSRDHVSPAPGLEHVLERALGLDADVQPHFFESILLNGDLLLLCSDGVYNILPIPDLRESLRHHAGARPLVLSARSAASPETLDDMSAIVLDIVTVGKLKAVKELPLEIPVEIQRGLVVDGFTLVKPFQHSDRVWLATRDGQRYTLKFAPVEARASDEILGLFVKEAWNAQRLQGSRFFPKVIEVENPTLRYYAMEFIEAPSLKTLLRSRSLAVDESVLLGKFLLEAGQHLLQYDLVHGDIKPENILVCPGYDMVQFKLVDFGSVTEIFSVTSRAGTASYLAPERFRETPISERTELFAVGVTLFEALTRSFPYGEIERFQTPRFTMSRRPTRLNPNIPSWLEAVLLRSLSPEAETRYQNYSEMMFDLNYPHKVTPFHPKGAALLEQNPVLFYKVAFFLMTGLCVVLLVLLLRG